ncbi:MAG: sulfur carrier protein ThiS [Pyrinomonadaceae bacterium]|nr:sulfur carrier protein ThiS [Pyrinomonadaceae bacterium]
MRVFINGETKEIADEMNLIELLVRFSLPRERVAVELNKRVVRRKDWETIRVKDSDQIEIVHFVGGG